MPDAALIPTLLHLGGIARTRTLVARGFSPYVQAKAVGEGVIQRVGRSWIAHPTADAQLISAASAGVVLTCVTQARRLGLWVLAEDRPHVGAAAHARIRVRRASVHWARPMIPRDPDALVDPIENVLAIAAACQPFETALAIWESALHSGLVTLETMRRLPLPAGARALCIQATPWSDSGLETFVVPRLRWLGLRMVRQAWIAGHRVDLLIGERLVVQIDGGTHVGAQRDEDNRHDAELALLGYHVIRVGYRQVIERWHEVQDLVMRAVAQGLHLARPA
jgi:very-short-patch-repair endonuclease